jgi:hypothetical protein
VSGRSLFLSISILQNWAVIHAHLSVALLWFDLLEIGRFAQAGPLDKILGFGGFLRSAAE